MAGDEALYDKAISLTEQFFNINAEFQEKNCFASLKSHMAAFCEGQQRFDVIRNLTEESLASLENAEDPEAGKQVINNFQIQMDKLKGITAEKNVRYNAFVKKIEEAWDEDLTVLTATKQVIDPISKKRMVKPVKNKVCGHHYEESAVLQLIKLNPKTRCPMVGCIADTFINKKDLIRDKDLEEYLVETLHDASTHIDESGILLDSTIQENS